MTKTHGGPVRSGNGTRSLKAYCRKCFYITRTSAKWLKKFGPPICPNPKCNGAHMVREHVQQEAA